MGLLFHLLWNSSHDETSLLWQNESCLCETVTQSQHWSLIMKLWDFQISLFPIVWYTPLYKGSQASVSRGYSLHVQSLTLVLLTDQESRAPQNTHWQKLSFWFASRQTKCDGFPENNLTAGLLEQVTSDMRLSASVRLLLVSPLSHWPDRVPSSIWSTLL